MTSQQRELKDLTWELGQLYRKGSTDQVLIEDYWISIEQLEEELNVEK